MNKVAVCIPARLNSKRFPRKVLHPILGVPMVIRVANVAAQVVGFGDIFIVTPDQEVADLAAQHGFLSILNEQPANSGTHKIAQCAGSIPHDLIVNLQGDEAAATPDDLQIMIDATVKYEHALRNMHVVTQSYSWMSRKESTMENVKLVTDQSDSVLFMSRQPIPTFDGMLKKSNGLYGMPKVLLRTYLNNNKRMPLESGEDVEQQRFLDLGIKMKAVEIEGSMTVDLPCHVKMVENILKCR